MMPCRQLVSTALRLCAVAVLCADGIAMRGRAQAPVTTIQPSAGFAVDRTIAPKTADRYELSLAEGQFVDLVVAFTNDADALRVTLSDPAGTALVYFDRVRTSSGAQRLSYVADRSGIYGLAIAAAVDATDTIAYRLNLSELRDATDADRGRAQALSEFLSAERQFAERSANGYRNAIPHYRTATALWSASGDRAEEAQAWHRLAQQHDSLSDYAGALEANQRALRIRHELGDTRGEGTSLQNLGNVYYNLANYPMALQCWERALPLRRETHDRNGEAFTLSSIGVAYQSMGDAQKGLEYYERAIPLWRAASNHEGEALGLHNAGAAHRLLGHTQQALELYAGALRLRRAAGDRAGTAQTLTQIATTHYELGDFEKALEAADEALPLRRAAGDRRGEAYTLQTIGLLLAGQHEYSAAFERLSAARAIFEAVGDRDGEGFALLYAGRALISSGDPKRALEALSRARDLFGAVGDRGFAAAAATAMAEAHARVGETDASLNLYADALSAMRAFHSRRGEATALIGLARLEQRLGRLDDARAHAEALVGIVESLRSEVASPELRASFLSSSQNAYGLSIDLEMQLDAREPGRGHDGAALLVSERARARGLLDALGEARSRIQGGVDPQLLAQEQQLKGRIVQADERLTRLLNTSSAKPDAIASAERHADQLVEELRDVQRQLRTLSPQYAALTQPSSLDVAGIQRLLDADTVLLEYALGPERSYVWAVARDTLTAAALPGRQRIEDAARRAYVLLGGGARRETRLQTQRALEAVADLVLAPVATALSHRRVVVIADGALQYIPFAALPHPPVRMDALSRRDPLVATHDVVTLPSASALQTLRQSGRAHTGTRGELAVFADPVLRVDDPRVGAARGPHGASEAAVAGFDDLLRSASDAGLAAIDRLPFARSEARAIAALVPGDATLEALDFTASRATALAEMGRYRIVHFATHALLNSRHPELSGIILSLVDRDAQPIDGFLRLHDVYNLPLNADLVVLSACRTALGKDISGEGLVGLTRGFMYAGAPAVVASLWDVRDRSTSELMTRFYRAMLRDGLAPAAALRAAQASMWRNPRWSAPAHWAGFILQGDWQHRD